MVGRDRNGLREEREEEWKETKMRTKYLFRKKENVLFPEYSCGKTADVALNSNKTKIK